MVKFAVEIWWKMLLTLFPSKRSSKISCQTSPEVHHQFRWKLRQLHSGNRRCLHYVNKLLSKRCMYVIILKRTVVLSPSRMLGWDLLGGVTLSCQWVALRCTRAPKASSMENGQCIICGYVWPKMDRKLTNTQPKIPLGRNLDGRRFAMRIGAIRVNRFARINSQKKTTVAVEIKSILIPKNELLSLRWHFLENNSARIFLLRYFWLRIFEMAIFLLTSSFGDFCGLFLACSE